MEQSIPMALSHCTRHGTNVDCSVCVSRPFLTVITQGKDSQFSRTGEMCTMGKQTTSGGGEICSRDGLSILKMEQE